MTDQQPFPQNYATNEPFFTSTSSRCHQHDVLISPPGTGIYSYIHRYPESNAKNCHSNGIEQQAVDVPLRHVSHAGCIIIPASRQRCEPSWNTSVCWYRSTQVGMALCDLVSLWMMARVRETIPKWADGWLGKWMELIYNIYIVWYSLSCPASWGSPVCSISSWNDWSCWRPRWVNLDQG
jgi:hypothetical protein